MTILYGSRGQFLLKDSSRVVDLARSSQHTHLFSWQTTPMDPYPF